MIFQSLFFIFAALKKFQHAESLIPQGLDGPSSHLGNVIFLLNSSWPQKKKKKLNIEIIESLIPHGLGQHTN